jgi:prepilin-type processing-associated H-X9-DG protein
LASACANDGAGNSWYFAPGQRDNPTNLPELWGYGFNTGYTYCNNTGLTTETPNTVNGGATYDVTIGSTVVPAVIRGTVHAGKSFGAVTAPSNTLMLGSTNGLPLMSIDIDNLRPLGISTIHYTQCELVSRNTGGVDSGGYTMAYVDGHAKWLTFNPTLAANVTTYNGYGDALTTLSIADPCQLESDYDGSSDTPEKCKEGFPNG